MTTEQLNAKAQDSDRKLTKRERFELGIAILNSEEMRAKMPPEGWPADVIARACGVTKRYVHMVVCGALLKMKNKLKQPNPFKHSNN